MGNTAGTEQVLSEGFAGDGAEDFAGDGAEVEEGFSEDEEVEADVRAESLPGAEAVR